MKNTIADLLSKHRSIRKFLPEMPTQGLLDQILNAAQAAPSFLNGQQYSIIEVRDPLRKDKMAHLCGDQAWISQAPVFFIFCMDFYRTHLALDGLGLKEIVSPRAEALLVGAVDVGLALANAGTAAESLGLGYVPIGGVRQNAQEMIDILGLPPRVFPVVGMALGYADEEPEVKPRLNREAIHHKETYQTDSLKEKIQGYDDIMEAYTRKRTGGKAPQTWSQRLTTFYAKNYFPGVTEALKNQGFELL